MGNEYEIIWPGFFNALPSIIWIIVFPLILIYHLFRKTDLKLWQKIIIIPSCIIFPIAVGEAVPYILQSSGFIKIYYPSEGTSVDATYSQTVNIFGKFSNYVWVFITTLFIIILTKNIKKKDFQVALVAVSILYVVVQYFRYY
jgi:hypothetical protein